MAAGRHLARVENLRDAVRLARRHERLAHGVGEEEEIEERYIPALYSREDEKERFNVIEQLADDDLSFTEVEYSEDVATMNVREGLVPQGDGIPRIFISPDCPQIVTMFKNYVDDKYKTNVALHQAIHEAVGVVVLAEPAWVPRGRKKNDA